MEQLPYDLLAKEITYLPFEDVRSFCQTDRRIHNFCLAKNPRHKTIWKRLIENTFGGLDNYDNILLQLSRKYNCPEERCYNYLIYVNFVNRLDPVIQAMIYYRQNDKESLDKISPLFRYYASFLMGNKDEMRRIHMDIIGEPVYYGQIKTYIRDLNTLSNIIKGRLTYDQVDRLDELRKELDESQESKVLLDYLERKRREL